MSELPNALHPFRSHGVRFTYKGEKSVSVDCPFCGRKKKVSIESDKGIWYCWSSACISKTWTNGKHANVLMFMRNLWAVSQDDTTIKEREVLRLDRGLRGQEILRDWGVCKSKINGNWLVPQFNEKLAMNNVCIYSKFANESKPTVKAPKATNTGFFCAPNFWDSERPIVDICEGVWDGAAYQEALRLAEIEDRNVLAIPGIDSWKDSWASLIKGKKVNILFDNDKPKKGEKVSAARSAIARLVPKLEKASEVNCLLWGREGFSNEFPAGCDLRDYLSGV